MTACNNTNHQLTTSTEEHIISKVGVSPAGLTAPPTHKNQLEQSKEAELVGKSELGGRARRHRHHQKKTKKEGDKKS